MIVHWFLGRTHDTRLRWCFTFMKSNFFHQEDFPHREDQLHREAPLLKVSRRWDRNPLSWRSCRIDVHFKRIDGRERRKIVWSPTFVRSFNTCSHSEYRSGWSLDLNKTSCRFKCLLKFISNGKENECSNGRLNGTESKMEERRQCNSVVFKFKLWLLLLPNFSIVRPFLLEWKTTSKCTWQCWKESKWSE